MISAICFSYFYMQTLRDTCRSRWWWHDDDNNSIVISVIFSILFNWSIFVELLQLSPVLKSRFLEIVGMWERENFIKVTFYRPDALLVSRDCKHSTLIQKCLFSCEKSKTWFWVGFHIIRFNKRALSVSLTAIVERLAVASATSNAVKTCFCCSYSSSRIYHSLHW